jgi:hypothetical protein
MQGTPADNWTSPQNSVNINLTNNLSDHRTMPFIRSLKPNVTREEAIRHFSGGIVNSAANWIRGPVHSIAELYIPFRLFHVKICSAGQKQNQTFALDAVRGVLDLYQIPALTDDRQFLTLRNSQCTPTDPIRPSRRAVNCQVAG